MCCVRFQIDALQNAAKIVMAILSKGQTLHALGRLIRFEPAQAARAFLKRSFVCSVKSVYEKGGDSDLRNTH